MYPYHDEWYSEAQYRYSDKFRKGFYAGYKYGYRDGVNNKKYRPDFWLYENPQGKIPETNLSAIYEDTPLMSDAMYPHDGLWE
jgi:hypothetical protein